MMSLKLMWSPTWNPVSVMSVLAGSWRTSRPRPASIPSASPMARSLGPGGGA